MGYQGGCRSVEGRRGWLAPILALLVIAAVLAAAPGDAYAVFPPTANDDAAEVAPGQTVEIAVLDNDTDDDRPAGLTVTRITAVPDVGTATIIDGTTISYRAPDPFTGTTFSYEISDGRDGTDTATVVVQPQGPTTVAPDTIELPETEIVEGDPFPPHPEVQPISVFVNGTLPVNVVVEVSTRTNLPDAPTLLEIDDQCIAGVDFATDNRFEIELQPGQNTLPILLCDDEVVELPGLLEVSIEVIASGEIAATQSYILEDDDLVSIQGPDVLPEGGVKFLSPVPFPFDIGGLAEVPQLTTYDFTYQLSPNAPDGSFRVRAVDGSGLAPACTDIVGFGDLELGDWFKVGVLDGRGSITTCGDPTPEASRPLVLEYVAQNGVIVDEGFSIVLRDDDQPTPVLSAESVEIDEPSAASPSKIVNVPISLESPLDYPYQILTWFDFTQSGAVLGAPGGTCDGDIEYIGELRDIPAGVTEFTIPIEVCPDAQFDPDGLATLIVSSPVAVVDPTVLLDLLRVPITIVDVHSTIPRVSISDAEIVEGDSGQEFAALEIAVAGGTVPIAVRWNALELAGGSVLRQATASSDFVGSFGNVVGFPVGGGTETILVPIVGDTSAEGDEYFRVTISSDGAEVTGGVGVVRIVDDDALRVSVLDAPDVVEGDSGFTEMAFTVVLDSAPSGTVRVRWETHDIGGAAQPDDPNIAVGFGPDRDFDANLGTLTFSADGPLTQQVVVHVRGDEQDEFTENVHLLLREVSGAGSPVIGDGVGVGRIIDDDDLPSRPDIEPPVFVGNADLDVTLPDGSNKVRVYWSVLAEDVVDGRVSHDCSPAVKSFFLVGETEIICVATDAAGNEATASFTVTVVESDQRLTDRDGRLTNEGRPGSFVNVQAAGFLPGSQVLADLRSDPIQLALLTADDKGIVDAELSLPLETTLGAHTIALIGIDSTGGSRHALFPTQIIEQTPDPTCTITGTPGNDRLFGTRGDDVICGLGGNDRIFGRGGNDILLGGPGDDRLSGGNGRDVLYGEAGDDVLRGDRGADRLVGDDGEDRLVGGRGADEMFGGRGADEMRGGTGGDQMYGGSGDDVLRGGPGNDELNGGPGDDKLRGNSGRDRLSGKSGNDDVRGGPGRDTIF